MGEFVLVDVVLGWTSASKVKDDVVIVWEWVGLEIVVFPDEASEWSYSCSWPDHQNGSVSTGRQHEVTRPEVHFHPHFLSALQPSFHLLEVLTRQTHLLFPLHFTLSQRHCYVTFTLMLFPTATDRIQPRVYSRSDFHQLFYAQLYIIHLHHFQ